MLGVRHPVLFVGRRAQRLVLAGIQYLVRAGIQYLCRAGAQCLVRASSTPCRAGIQYFVPGGCPVPHAGSAASTSREPGFSTLGTRPAVPCGRRVALDAKIASPACFLCVKQPKTGHNWRSWVVQAGLGPLSKGL